MQTQEQEITWEKSLKMFSFFLMLLVLPGKSGGVETGAQNELMER